MSFYCNNTEGCHLECNPYYGSKFSEARDKPIIEGLNIIEVFDGNSVRGYRIVSDISLIFDQKRLNSLSSDSIRSWLNTLQGGTSEPALSGLSDDQLLMFVKSRHIQSPSDLKAWSDHLISIGSDLHADADSVLSEIEEQRIAAKAAEVASSSASVPKKE
uniref:Internal scaffolding protein n=1 Tax=Dulem virus 263 TaxID=3145740 RepID=A0AAU8B0S6_9VIRU